MKNIQKLEPKTISTKNTKISPKISFNSPKESKTIPKPKTLNLNKEITKNSQYENDLKTLKSHLNII